MIPLSASTRPVLESNDSQLAIEIAKAYNGEIINSDALQLYKGLPVTTNKIPEHERDGIAHHLLDIVPIDEKPWTAKRFVAAALDAIASIRANGKIPVLVGGTHYYLQSLLFKDALVDTPDGDQQEEDLASRYPILKASTADIYSELRKVDPVMADRWHPSDRRKIQRSLEMYLTTGRPASEIYAEQQQNRSSSGAATADSSSGSAQQSVAEDASRLRFKTLVLWVHCAQDVLVPRLDARVDDMLRAGLLNEARFLHGQHAKLLASGQDVDDSSGLSIAIGYKEFVPYLRQQQQQQHLQQQQQQELSHTDTATLQKILDHAIDRTKIATRQYAKHQVQWIRNKMLKGAHAADPDWHLYLLDATDLSEWHAQVSRKAGDVASRFLALGLGEMPAPETLSAAAAREIENAAARSKECFVKRVCDVCDVVAVTQKAWDQHVLSRRHKKIVAVSARRGVEGVR